MKERNRRKKVSNGRTALLIIAVVLFINMAMVFISRLTPLRAGVASLMLILLVMVVAYKVMTDIVTEYCYTLTDKGLLFHRAMGIREIKLLEIPYDRITEVGHPDDPKDSEKVYYFLCDKNDGFKRKLTFNDKDKAFSVIFAPSDKFYNKLLKMSEAL